jgi:polyisoprenoid-binding protein YceI
MAVQPGGHAIGAAMGKITLRTFRDGLAAQAGHDLTIEMTRWSGELTVAEDMSLAELTVRIDMNSLVVMAGTGGLKPLTGKDKTEIAASARKVLRTDRYPVASFTAARFEPGPGGDGMLHGTLLLAGERRPVRLAVTGQGAGRYHATATIVQSDFQVTPYTAFLGALRVRDAVDVEIDAVVTEEPDLSGPGQGQAGR